MNSFRYHVMWTTECMPIVAEYIFCCFMGLYLPCLQMKYIEIPEHKKFSLLILILFIPYEQDFKFTNN